MNRRVTVRWVLFNLPPWNRYTPISAAQFTMAVNNIWEEQVRDELREKIADMDDNWL